MKVFVAFACLIVCVSANGWNVPAKLSTGTSQSSRTQDSAGNYAFSYNEQHATGGSSRAESGNGWGAQGSYSLNVGDGRQRVVKYVADGAGFRAAISTNEPGTAALPAASTSISSPYAPPQPVQPLPVAAPVVPVVKAISSGWNSGPALPALAPAPLPEPALPAVSSGWNSAPALPVVSSGWNSAPALPVLSSGWSSGPALPVVAKAVPAVSSYSTSINHVSAPAAIAIAAPEPIAQLKGWN